MVAEPVDPATVYEARRYRFTVVPVATTSRSEVVVDAVTVVNVARSTKVMLSDECCTLTMTVPLRVFVGT